MFNSETPRTAVHQASLSNTNSWSLLKLMFIQSVRPSNHLILCHSLLLQPSIFPIIRVFSNESVLRIRWPKYWSFSFSISPSSEYSGLIFFRMDLLDLLAVQGTLKILLQHRSSKASIIQHSAFFIVQLSHPYMTKVQDTNNRLCSSKAFALKHHVILPWKLVFPRDLDLGLGLFHCTLFLMVSTFTWGLPCLSFFWDQALLTIQWLDNYTWISHWHLNINLSRMRFTGLLLSLFLYSQWNSQWYLHSLDIQTRNLDFILSSSLFLILNIQLIHPFPAFSIYPSPTVIVFGTRDLFWMQLVVW